MSNHTGELTENDLNDLRSAKIRLEYPGLTARLVALIGKPIETGIKLLPKNWNEKVAGITQTALGQLFAGRLDAWGDSYVG